MNYSATLDTKKCGPTFVMYRVIPRAGVYDSDEEALPFFIVALFQSTAKNCIYIPNSVYARWVKKKHGKKKDPAVMTTLGRGGVETVENLFLYGLT